jgi:hypothetical protein
MKALKIAVPILAILGVLLVWMLPIGPAAGIFIGGSDSTAPDTWPDTSSVHEIKLKVAGNILPSVVNIWLAQVENSLYIVGATDSGWVSKLGTGSPVQMRMANDTYTLQARLVTTGWQPILEAYQDKYRPDYPDIVNGFPTIEEAATSIAVFKLERF